MLRTLKVLLLYWAWRAVSSTKSAPLDRAPSSRALLLLLPTALEVNCLSCDSIVIHIRVHGNMEKAKCVCKKLLRSF